MKCLPAAFGQQAVPFYPKEREDSLTKKERLHHIVKNLDAYFAGFMFAVTLSLVVINVFTRYFLNYIIPWSEEVATSCFVYTTFVGGAWCLRTRQLVGVDILVDKFSEKTVRIITVITDAIIVFLNAYITYLAVRFTYSSRIKTMPILKISSVYLNAALILGFGLMTVYSVFNLIQSINNVNKPIEKEDRK